MLARNFLFRTYPAIQQQVRKFSNVYGPQQNKKIFSNVQGGPLQANKYNFPQQKLKETSHKNSTVIDVKPNELKKFTLCRGGDCDGITLLLMLLFLGPVGILLFILFC